MTANQKPATNPARAADHDTQLMRLLADGDTSALAELIERHQRHVLEIAYRTVQDRYLAEDIGQETFLRVWRHAGRYRSEARFSTWLYRIVVNLCFDAIRKKKAVTSNHPDMPGDPELDPVVAMGAQERVAAVRQAVGSLPERQRVAVVLHRFSGASLREISESTGWSESAIESLLARAYKALRAGLRTVQET